MNIYHIKGILDWHHNWKQVRHLEQMPDLASSLKSVENDVLWQMRGNDYEDPKETEDNVDAVFGIVRNLKEDIPKEVEDYAIQQDKIITMVSDLTTNLLDAYSLIRRLENYIQSENFDNNLLEKVQEIRSSIGGCIEPECSNLRSLLISHSWPEMVVSQIMKLLGMDYLYIELLPESSHYDNMKIGRGKWLSYDGCTITLKMEDISVLISTDKVVVNNKGINNTHLLCDLASYFNDWTDPTDPELANYEMVMDKEWDIRKWKDILSCVMNSE